MALLLAVFYYVAVKLDLTQKLTVMAEHILKSTKQVFGIPDFEYYTLGDGLSKYLFPFTRTTNKTIRNTAISTQLWVRLNFGYRNAL